MTREELVARWTARKVDYEKLDAQVSGSAVCAAFLEDLETLWAAERDQEVDLKRASDISGYSTDHLRRLARDKKIPVTHSGRRLVFRVADLPRKPTRLDSAPWTTYDPQADARRVAARRNGR